MIIQSTLPYLYAAACLGVIGFQIALIFGAPWGHLTQGGQQEGSLKRSGRIAASVSIFIVIFKALAILSAGGLWPGWPAWTGWTALGIQSIVTLLNWITRSRPERLLWAPITSAMLILAALVIFLP